MIQPDGTSPKHSGANLLFGNPTAIAISMVVISIAGSLLVMATSILFARRLGPEGFQAFAVAIAALSLAGTLCEFGTGKYALRVMPQYVSQKQWNLAAGYIRYSAILVLVTGVLGGLFGLWETGGFTRNSSGLGPFSLACLFLPTTAMLAVVAEFLMANRRAVTSSIVMRLVCPGATLLLFGMAVLFSVPLGSGTAILCFGGGGVIGLAVLLILYWQLAPAELLSARPEFRIREWTRNCLWYVLLAFLMSWLYKLSLVVLKAAQIGEIEIARFAAALEVACLILIVAKSTNKYYQPEVSMIMSRRDWISGLRLSKQRMLLIGTICVSYFLVMVVFGRQILGLFGEDFAEGYLSLCLMSLGTCTATAFSLAPEYLKFSGRLKTVLSVNCAAGVLLVVLTLVLGGVYGVTGAGLAFGLVISASAVVFRLIGARQLARESGSADSPFLKRDTEP